MRLYQALNAGVLGTPVDCSTSSLRGTLSSMGRYMATSTMTTYQQRLGQHSGIPASCPNSVNSDRVEGAGALGVVPRMARGLHASPLAGSDCDDDDGADDDGEGAESGTGVDGARSLVPTLPLPQLHDLDVNCMSAEEAKSLPASLSLMTGLRTLSLSGKSMSPEGAKALAACLDLRGLTLEIKKATDDDDAQYGDDKKAQHTCIAYQLQSLVLSKETRRGTERNTVRDKVIVAATEDHHNGSVPDRIVCQSYIFDIRYLHYFIAFAAFSSSCACVGTN
eukprot:TRINITY_DN8353_c0_g2_i2.p1 TRINITY_DN8353_c0_g2~~TRINITY_DN8353_c0_g2_i2.p1  ORF type:complete len:279 (-),score=22.57 TRINITY_DN8353_c0_g2_i2:41-877(-)